MATANKELMRQAREALRGKWDLAIGTCLIYSIITGGLSAIPFHPPIGTVFGLVVGGPMALDMAYFALAMARDGQPRLENIFQGFNDFSRSAAAYVLMVIYIVLWSLLLVVPGIIAAISYSQTFYILAEDKSADAIEALNRSQQMMYGYKWKYFHLVLRFFGWGLLCILTLGIGFLWLVPYVQVTLAKFHDDIKDRPMEQV